MAPPRTWLHLWSIYDLISTNPVNVVQINNKTVEILCKNGHLCRKMKTKMPAMGAPSSQMQQQSTGFFHDLIFTKNEEMSETKNFAILPYPPTWLKYINFVSLHNVNIFCNFHEIWGENSRICCKEKCDGERDKQTEKQTWSVYRAARYSTNDAQ